MCFGVATEHLHAILIDGRDFKLRQSRRRRRRASAVTVADASSVSPGQT